MPLLEMKGNRLGRSVEMMHFIFSTKKTVEATWWFQSMLLRGGGRGGSGSGWGSDAGLLVVDRILWRVRCIRPMMVGIDSSR